MPMQKVGKSYRSKRYSGQQQYLARTFAGHCCRDGFLDLLFKEAQAQGSTILFVSHDPHIASHFPRLVDLQRINTPS